VVDDEPGMRYMARRILEPRFEVLEAESGEVGLALLRSERIHFAIVDISLPGLSGLDLLTEIKQSAAAVDVVVMTGSVRDPDEALEDAIRRKAFFFLRKPFPMTVLETLADRIVETQELSEQVNRYLHDLERDLEAARVFQRRLFPPTPWSGDRIEIASSYVASARLSGDFLDYWELPGGGTAFLVADVMGHGPAAAMMTGMVKSQLHRLSDELTGPGEVLQELESDLQRQGVRGFLTAFLLFDRPQLGRVDFSGAGHPDVYLWRPSSKRIDLLTSDGLPLNTGLAASARRSHRLEREADLRFFLYTDGYREASGPTGELFDDPFEGQPSDDVWSDRARAREPLSRFHEAVAAAIRAASPGGGLAQFEAAWRDFTRREGDDDRAAVLAWLS
jgi:sigma-B regulation protein RsbU (phosphoserine phosphatase)